LRLISMTMLPWIAVRRFGDVLTLFRLLSSAG
jgi:hypothetical protein